MKYTLTQKQKKLYDFIRLNLKEKGSMPLTSEMQKHMKSKSANSIFMFLNQLEKRGYIIRGEGLRGSISLALDNQQEILQLRNIKAAASNFVSCQQAFRADPENAEYHAPKVSKALKTLKDLIR